MSEKIMKKLETICAVILLISLVVLGLMIIPKISFLIILFITYMIVKVEYKKAIKDLIK